MAITIYRKPDPILEITPVNDNIPSLSEFIGAEMGYYLCALKDKWIFPFIRNKVRLNIASITMPSNTFGIVSINCEQYYTEFTKVTGSIDLYDVTVISKQFLPFKIFEGEAVVSLSIVPFIECHVVEHKNIELIGYIIL